MKTFTLLAFAVAALAWSAHAQSPPAPPAPPLSLWYRQPAATWNEALPVGNGRLGAMVFGGVTSEQLQLNEDTLWSGGGVQPIPPDGGKSLPEIRALLFDGKYAAAESLVRSKLLVGRGEGNSHQTMGDLFVRTDLKGEATDYRRSLDLDTGVAITTFKVNGVTYRREVLSSAPDQVVVLHLSADRPGKITFSAEFKRSDV
jgi:alpha-L-fucosidase 2